jgi:hypothetical protein
VGKAEAIRRKRITMVDYNDRGGGFKIIGYLLTIGLVIYVISNAGSCLSESPKKISNSEPPYISVAPQAAPGPKPQKPIATPFTDNAKPETEREFKASCLKIVQKDDGKNVYYKELLKNPDKFVAVRLRFPAKIMTIEEADGNTAIQAYISDNYDTAIIAYTGTMNIYEGDIIQVYGVGMGKFEGANAMGASVAVPAVAAKYIKKMRSGE